MKQSKFYKYIIWSLIGLNIAVLAFFLISKNDAATKLPIKNNRSEVIALLRLDEQQAAELNKLADEHTRRMIDFKKQQAELLSPYFQNVINAEGKMANDSLQHVDYLALERAKIEMTYAHFQEIKDLLKEEQLPHFQEFMNNTINRVLLGKKKTALKRRT